MIRVFVGCAANTEDAESQAVLEYTLRKHSSKEIDITWMKLSRDPNSPFYSEPEKGLGWNTTNWATPFSAFRWIIPSLCDFSGKAIYMDSDIIVMSDIAQLWDQEFGPKKVVLAKGGSASWRYCVSLWDCKAVKPHLLQPEELRRNPAAHNLMCQKFARNPAIVQPFSGNWNCLDGEKYDTLLHPDIKAIHYTSMKHQPQHKYAAKRLAAKGMRHWFDGAPAKHWRRDLQELFDKLLGEAESNGFPVSKYEGDPLYGPYKKKKVGGQGKTVPHWGRK